MSRKMNIIIKVDKSRNGLALHIRIMEKRFRRVRTLSVVGGAVLHTDTARIQHDLLSPWTYLPIATP